MFKIRNFRFQVLLLGGDESVKTIEARRKVKGQYLTKQVYFLFNFTIHLHNSPKLRTLLVR